jgi:hypothetical protein
MKKIFFAIALISLSTFVQAAPPVTEKVLKIFQAIFPDVQNAKWYENENHYEVYFDKDDMKCRIRYDFDGKVMSTIRYYSEKSFPPFLRLKVSQKHPGKKIFGVTELNTDSELTYNIVLEDDKNWYHVSADAIGQLATTEKFKKAAN